jgi:hypothetical protein
MTNYDVIPQDSALSKVRLYGDSLEVLEPRTQRHAVTRFAEEGGGLANGTPAPSDTAGIEPGDLILRGDWVGADAAALAERLIDIFDDTSVTEVEVARTDADSDDIEGTYRIGERAQVGQIVAGDDSAYEYTLQLIESNT